MEIKTINSYSQYYPVKLYSDGSKVSDITICFRRNSSGEIEFADCIYTDDAVNLFFNRSELQYPDSCCHMVFKYETWPEKHIFDRIQEYDRLYININYHRRYGSNV